MKGTLITSTPKGSVQLLAVQGIIVAECYHQVAELIRNRLGDAYVLLFAEPVFDESGDTIDWYSPVQGSLQSVSSLAVEEQNAIRAKFVNMAKEIESCIEALSSTGEGKRKLSAEILKLALQYPDQDSLYLIGEQPVLICWGCGPSTIGVEPQDLKRLEPISSIKPQATEITGAQTGAGLPERGLPVASRVGAGGTETSGFRVGDYNSDRNKRHGFGSFFAFLGWLLTFCLGGLFLLLLFGYNFSKDDLQKYGAFSKSILIDLDAARTDTVKLEEDLEKARLQVIDYKALCQGKTANVPVPKGNALVIPKPKPDSGKKIPDSRNKEKPLENADLSFLQGNWECRSGLESTEGNPVVMEYNFDSKGQGKVIIHDGKMRCTAEVTAQLYEKGLQMTTDSQIICPDGSSFSGQIIECEDSGSKTICRGSNMSDEAVWDANFHKIK